MRRFADFIVNRRILLLVLVACVSVAGAIASPFVPVIADESSYLQEDSEIREGLEIIDAEFPETAHEYSIRVMFQGLSSVQKPDVERRLYRVPYVSSVTYGEGEEYNKDAYTLYILTTDYGYGTQQQRDLMEGLEEEFQDFRMTVENDSESLAALPWWLPLAALGASALFLFIFCSSWTEPLLILAASVMAACMNAGSNLAIGRISQLAASLCPTLVFLTAVAFCLILSYRWRKELRRTRNPYEAMKLAAADALPVLLAAAFATGAGFLMLIFLQSGLAADVGIVAAKGTAFALIAAVFTVPGMWLLSCDSMQRTRKRSPRFRKAGVARIQYDHRRGFFTAFLCVFAVSCALPFFTTPAFGISRRDPIAAQFPEENHITVVYQNGDENPAGRLANQFLELPDVSGVSSYATTLGKQYTPDAMYTMLRQTGSAMDFSLPILQILYYDYFTDEQLPFIKAADLIRFINTDVESAEGIGDLLRPETKTLFARMGPFADEELLHAPVGIAQAGQILGLDQEQTIALYSAYYSVRGGNEEEKMSPVTFLDYVINNIAPDPAFAEEMTPEETERLKALQTYADPETAAAGMSMSQAAQMEGFDEETMRAVYTEYFARQPSYEPQAMTLAAFADFLQNTVLEDEFFSSSLPDGLEATLRRVLTMSDAQQINTQMSAAQLAQFFGLAQADAEDVVGIYRQTDTGLMSVSQFLSYLNTPEVWDAEAGSMSEAQQTMLPRINAAVQSAVNAEELTPTQISQTTALPMSIVESVFSALSPEEEEPVERMRIEEFLVAVTSDAYASAIDEADMAGLRQMQSVVNTSLQGGQFAVGQMAEITDLSQQQVSDVYKRFSRQQTSGQTMSPSEFAHFAASQGSSDGALEAAEITRLRSDSVIMDTAQRGNALSPEDAASLFGLDGEEAKLLYTFHDSFTPAGAAWSISLADLLEFLASDEMRSSGLVPENREEQLRLDARLAAASADGEEFSAAEMAELLSLDAAFAEQAYLRYMVESGEVNEWTIPLYELIGFVTDTGDTGYKGEGLEWVRQLRPLIDAVAEGKQYSALGFYMLLEGLGQNVDESTVELIYLYYATVHNSSGLWTLSPLELVDFLTTQVLEQPAYSAYMDEAMQEQIRELQRQIEASRARLKGPNYSLMTINTTESLDSPAMRELFETVREELDSTLIGTYYLTGNIPVAYEMAKDFTAKWMLLTLLTDVCAFAAACFLMGSFLAPLILTCLAQCAVWLVTGIMGATGDVYYLALLIGQCFMIGAVSAFSFAATDDYRENRRVDDREEAARGIFTEGAAMATLAGAATMLASFAAVWLLAPATAPGQISRLGCLALLCGEILTLFFLPGMLTLLDGFIKAKPAPRVPIERKERPGGGWEGKRLLDEDTLVGLAKGTFQSEEKPSSWAAFVPKDRSAEAPPAEEAAAQKNDEMPEPKEESSEGAEMDEEREEE